MITLDIRQKPRKVRTHQNLLQPHINELQQLVPFLLLAPNTFLHFAIILADDLILGSIIFHHQAVQVKGGRWNLLPCLLHPNILA